MTDASEWRGRVGDAWAEEWRRTERTIGPVQPPLLDALLPRLGPAPAILDIGCGVGSTALALAAARPDADILGIDLSEKLIAVARERSTGRAAFEVADASVWRPADGRRFDALVSRHGVMFFDDPIAAFAHLRALAAPGASLVFSCFRAREENQWAAALAPILLRFAPGAAAAPPPDKGPFAFADPGRIEAILLAAGFGPPEIAPFDFTFVAGAGDGGKAAVDDAVSFFERIGPFAALLRELNEARRGGAKGALAEVAARHCEEGEIRFRAAAWIVACASA